MRSLRTVLSVGVLIGLAGSAAPAQDRPSPNEHDAPAPRGRDADAGPDPRGERQTGAYLGVATSPPAAIVREQLKLAQGMGLVVDLVEKGSPAEQAGIRQYDVLTKLGDQLLVNGEQLAVLVRSRKPGDEVELTVVRGGEPTRVKAKLVEHELPPLEDILFFRGNPMGGHPPDDMRLAPMLPQDARIRPRPGRSFAARTVTTWSDGAHTLSVTTEQGKPVPHLVARDKHGTVLYDGELAGDKMPTLVKEKLKKMQETGVPLPPEPAPSTREADRPSDKP